MVGSLLLNKPRLGQLKWGEGGNVNIELPECRIGSIPSCEGGKPSELLPRATRFHRKNLSDIYEH